MYMYVCLYMYVGICMHVYVCMYVCMYMCVYAYMYMYVCIIYGGIVRWEMSYPKREGELSGGNCPKWTIQGSPVNGGSLARSRFFQGSQCQISRSALCEIATAMSGGSV